MFVKQSLIILFSCCLAACAGTSEQGDAVADDEPRGRSDCIHEPSIRGYSVLDEQNLIVEASGRRDYHVELQRRAHGLRHSFGIQFDATTSRVCAGFDGIKYKDSMGGYLETVRIASIRKLSPEEKDQLLIQFGKKEPEIENMPAPQEVDGADVEELDEAAGE